MNSLATKPERLIKYQWTFGRDDVHLWKPGKGRNKYITEPVYIPTPDGDHVLEEVDRCVEAWKKNNNPFIKQCNKSCFLLWGPHGTFKTSLVKLIACKYLMNLAVITQHELHEDTFRRMMECLDPGSIVLFDDIDLDMFKDNDDEDDDDELIRSKGRGRNGRRWGRGMKSVMKTVMDGTVNLPDKCLFFICCNNTELDIDIKSRFTPHHLGSSRS